MGELLELSVHIVDASGVSGDADVFVRWVDVAQ
jgi:hypothetical protein